MRHLLILTCLLFGTGATAEEGDFDFNGLIAKKALRDYKKAVAKDKKATERKQKQLDEEAAILAKKTRNEFVESLRKALKTSMQAENLEEANKIDAAIKALIKGASPAGASAENRKAQKEANRTTQVEYWPNGQKIAEGHFKDGNPDGRWTQWYENGQKQAEGYYKNGKQEGLETWWHENGQKHRERHYKNGKLEGLATRWRKNGQKEWEGYYKNGKQVR